jgi:POT family proton-dependent oligopeptide transporter
LSTETDPVPALEPTGMPVTAFERRFGHPPGLVILFFAEMWERFSYYGMRGLLKLYMVNYLFITLRQTFQGASYDAVGDPGRVFGWGFMQKLLPMIEPAPDSAGNLKCVADAIERFGKGDAAKGMAPLVLEKATELAHQTCAVTPHASMLYGLYTGLVYFTPFFGGIIADRYLGQRKTVVVGGVLMAIGHFVMAFENQFFLALLLLIIGNGAFKPNVSTQVGDLYKPGDPRRDGAFTIFYMGINLGSLLCNIVCGTLAVHYGWHYGFAAAGVGMCLGLTVYTFGGKYLAPDTFKRPTPGVVIEKEPLTKKEWTSVWALVILCALNIVFWAVYEQQGNTMQSWADEQTIWPNILGFQIPSTWFQSFNPLCIVLLAPLFDMFWRRQAKKGTEPSSVSKMAIGCFILGGSFIVMIIGAKLVGNGQGSMFWPLFCTFLLTIGELYLSPIGLSLVTKVSPVRIVSMMMGMWLASSFFGNILSGYIGIYYTRWSKESFFLMLTVLGLAAGASMWAFNKPLKKAIGSDI